jgi:restriction system protein
MARRRYRRPSNASAALGSGLFLVILLASSVRQHVLALPLPWQIVGVLVGCSLCLVIGWGVVALVRRARDRQLLQTNLQELSPNEFEQRIQRLLDDLGWVDVQQRGRSGDRGVDLVGIYHGERYIVQCKRYRKAVAPTAVRDLVGALHIQQADRALLVTTSTFTAQGYAEARDQPLTLWDGNQLAAQIRLADERRADPMRRQAARQRLIRLASIVMLINASAICWALASAGSPFVSR